MRPGGAAPVAAMVRCSQRAPLFSCPSSRIPHPRLLAFSFLPTRPHAHPPPLPLSTWRLCAHPHLHLQLSVPSLLLPPAACCCLQSGVKFLREIDRLTDEGKLTFKHDAALTCLPTHASSAGVCVRGGGGGGGRMRKKRALGCQTRGTKSTHVCTHASFFPLPLTHTPCRPRRPQ